MLKRSFLSPPEEKTTSCVAADGHRFFLERANHGADIPGSPKAEE